MKILTFADFHLGVQTYGKTDPTTNLNTRVLKALESLDEMIDYAIKKKIKVVVFAGDAYKNSSVLPNIQAEFNKRMRRLVDHGIQLLLLDGNHDVDKMETKKSPLNVYDDLKVPSVIQTRFHKEVEITIDNETIKFVFLPTYHTEQELREIVDNTVYDGKPIVYIFHGTIRGANLNDWNIAEKETYVEPDIFDKPGVAAVIMGHLHKHQTLYNQPLIYYCGSLQRVDFSEEKQPKGFVVLNVKEDSTVTYEFIEVESQKFFTLNDNLIGKQDETDYIIEQLNKNIDKIEKAIVRIRLDMDKSNFINEQRLNEHCYKLGASFVLKVEKRYEKKDSVRNSNLTEHVDEHKALKIYFEGKDNEDKLIQLGDEIILRAKKEGRIS